MRASLTALLLASLPAAASAVGVDPDTGEIYDPIGNCDAEAIVDCQDLGGEISTPGDDCICEVEAWVSRRFTNASKGDVNLVANGDGRGSPLVSLITDELGQTHRHALVFLDNGRNVRHDSMDDPGTKYVFPSGVRLDPADLRNGLPGTVSQTVDEAWEWGRLGDDGLVLKPRQMTSVSRISGRTTVSEPNRPLFEDAADIAEANEGYYKISDYTEMVGMDLSLIGDRDDDDLRGTHCSGFVHFAFTEAGLPISNHFYDEALRQDVAEAAYDQIRSDVHGTLGLGIVILPDAADDIANQVVNCFAGLGCDNISNDWEDGVGDGEAVSPDNLLPTSFTLAGSGSTVWNGRTKSAGQTLSNEEFGAPTTPFRRLEPQTMTGGYWDVDTYFSWTRAGGWQ